MIFVVGEPERREYVDSSPARLDPHYPAPVDAHPPGVSAATVLYLRSIALIILYPRCRRRCPSIGAQRQIDVLWVVGPLFKISTGAVGVMLGCRHRTWVDALFCDTSF